MDDTLIVTVSVVLDDLPLPARCAVLPAAVFDVLRDAAMGARAGAWAVVFGHTHIPGRRAR